MFLNFNISTPQLSSDGLLSSNNWFFGSFQIIIHYLKVIHRQSIDSEHHLNSPGA